LVDDTGQKRDNIRACGIEYDNSERSGQDMEEGIRNKSMIKANSALYNG